MSLLALKKKTHNQQSLFSPPELRCVLEVSSINYSFKSEEDQIDIIENFGRFLNSLVYPIQILCDSQIVNPSEWMLKVYDKDYHNFLKDIVSKKNVNQKVFYIAFTANDSFELNTIKGNIEKQMKKCRLISKEVSPNNNHLVPQLKPGFIKIGDWYHNTFAVTNWPHSGHAGWLEDLYNIEKNISLSMFIHPVNKEEAIKFLNKKLARLQASSIVKEEDAENDGLEDESIITALNMRNELYKNEGKFFYMSYYITIKSKSKEQLKKDTAYIKSILNGLMIDTKQAFLRQDDGFRCSLPHGVNYLQAPDVLYTFTTTPLKRFFPFISANIVDEGGVLIGENLLNNSLIFLNHFKYLTASTLVLGKAGSGKSYTIKAKILKMVKQGIEVTVLDREGEFGKLPKQDGLIVKKFNTIELYRQFLQEYWDKVTANPTIPRYLVIDEFWEYMKDEAMAALIQAIVKMGRKRYLGLCAITQEVEDLLESEYARSLINNCSIKILLKMESNQREAMRKTFGLTNAELSFLVSADEGEGILFAGTNHVQFKTLVSEEHHKLITTKPQELVEEGGYLNAG